MQGVLWPSTRDTTYGGTYTCGKNYDPRYRPWFLTVCIVNHPLTACLCVCACACACAVCVCMCVYVCVSVSILFCTRSAISRAIIF